MKNNSIILEEILLSWKRCTKRGLIEFISSPMIYIGRNALEQRLLTKKN